MELVQDVDKGFFPLDEELKLLPGELTPHGHENLVRLCGWMPFEKAAEMFAALQEIEVSPALSQRSSERAGADYVDLQTKEVEYLECEMPDAPKGGDKLQMSADGAMVPLLHGQWGEVRTLVIGEVQPAVQEQGEWVVHTRNLSYFSRKMSAEEFTRLALVETQRRGIETADQVGALMDGSDWLQGLTDHHRPDAVRILDFPHAGDHISLIGEFLHGEGTPQTQEWINQRLHQLKHEGPTELLSEFHQLQEQYSQEKAVTGNLAYLEKRQAQMQYPIFQNQGWPIGSGIVESGNKLVVEVRLKGSGMHWADKHVNSMLAIRNILCSDRWKQEWPRIETQLRQQASQRRRELRQSRRNQRELTAQQLLPLISPGIIETLNSAPPELIQPDFPKQPKENPWRKFKYGRSLFQRTDLPKN
jgi:hypothetical protein